MFSTVTSLTVTIDVSAVAQSQFHQSMRGDCSTVPPCEKSGNLRFIFIIQEIVGKKATQQLHVPSDALTLAASLPVVYSDSPICR